MSTVIAGFPGIGKSHLFRDGSLNATDSDSSLFSWIEVNGEKQRNPEFPGNYIKHIQEAMQKNDIVLVSTHKDVRNALDEAEICYALVYPSNDCRESYLKRYEDRGSPKAFVDMMTAKFTGFVEECDNHESPYACHFELEPGEFLATALQAIQEAMPEFTEDLEWRKKAFDSSVGMISKMLQNQTEYTAPKTEA